MANKQLPIDAGAASEQFEAVMVNLAPVIGSYYEALLKNGVPETLAAQLIVEWHKLWWATQLNQTRGDQ